MATVRYEHREGIVTLRLDRPHGNAINPQLIEDLAAALDRIEADRAVRGVLLASAHPRIFCPGLDLRELSRLDRPAMGDFLGRFSLAYRRLFALPKPVVAAVAGHAVAGGCLLALCADHRVLGAGGVKLGMNEVRLGVPLPWGVAVIVRHTVRRSRLAEVVMLGRNFTGEEAVAAGLAQELAAEGTVEQTARERLEEFTAKDAAALASLKHAIRAEAVRSITSGDPVHADGFLDLWFSEETRRRIDEAVRALDDRAGR